MSSSDFVIVLSTTATLEDAKALARMLLESNNAACVNCLPGATSIYTWQGKLHEDNEVLLIIKTAKHLLENVKKTIENEHPYETPECLTLPITGGSEGYLGWLKEVLDHGN